MTKVFRSAILGAPGSGKGTLSSKIIEKFDICHISTGNIFRHHVEMETDLGRSVQKYISEGKLVPDVLATAIALNNLKAIADKNWLLDGFPRTLIQAEKLLMTYPLDVVINLKVPFDIIIDRLKNRWIHPASGRVYNLVYNMPKVPGRDNETGEPLIQRPDDKPEAIIKRLKIYSEHTEPLIQFYKKQNILKEFEGNTSDELWPQIDNMLLRYSSVYLPSAKRILLEER